MGQGAGLQVSDDLLDDGVAAVGGLGLDQHQGGVGEQGVVAVDREQFPLALGLVAGLWRRTRRTTSRAACWSALRRPVNAVYSTSAISASETHRPSSSSHTACGYLIGCQAVSSMAAMAACTEAVIRTVTEKRAPARRQAARTAAE